MVRGEKLEEVGAAEDVVRVTESQQHNKEGERERETNENGLTLWCAALIVFPAKRGKK